MPRPYNIQKEKWKRAGDPYLPKHEGRIDDIVIPYVLFSTPSEVPAINLASLPVSWALLGLGRAL
jgi:hypothetical protein